MPAEGWALLGVVIGGLVGALGTWLTTHLQLTRQERLARQTIYTQFLEALDEFPEILIRSVALNDEVMAEWDRLESNLAQLRADAVPDDESAEPGLDGDYLVQHYLGRITELAKESNRGPLPPHEREELHRVSLKANQMLSRMWLVAPSEVVIAAAHACDAVRQSMKMDDEEAVRTRGVFVGLARRDVGSKGLTVPKRLESPEGREPSSSA